MGSVCGTEEGALAIKSRAMQDPPSLSPATSPSSSSSSSPPWITALIESLSDVPWSRVILLPKQLLSSVVYSRLFHPAGAPASQPASQPASPPPPFPQSTLCTPLRLPTLPISRTISRHREIPSKIHGSSSIRFCRPRLHQSN